MKIIKVKSCQECPFSRWGKGDSKYCFKTEKKWDLPVSDGWFSEWCPLEDDKSFKKSMPLTKEEIKGLQEDSKESSDFADALALSRIKDWCIEHKKEEVFKEFLKKIRR